MLFRSALSAVVVFAKRFMVDTTGDFVGFGTVGVTGVSGVTVDCDA